MGDVFKKLRGITGSLFKIGNQSGPNLKNNAGAVEIRDTSDADFATGRANFIPASGETANDLPVLRDLQGRVPNITFDFDGASPPGAGSNTDEFGFCHTAGGGYSAGDVVYDTGSALVAIPASVCRTLTSSTTVTGTISLIQNGVYAREGATWVLKGDGVSTGTGFVKSIRIDYTFSDQGTPKSSTTQIPDGAEVLNARNVVETALNGVSPTMAVVVDGTADKTLLATGDSDMGVAADYQSDETHKITSSTTGPVQITIGGSTATAGSGYVEVLYTTAAA